MSTLTQIPAASSVPMSPAEEFELDFREKVSELLDEPFAPSLARVGTESDEGPTLPSASFGSVTGSHSYSGNSSSRYLK